MKEFKELELNDLESVAGGLDRSKLTAEELAHFDELEREAERVNKAHVEGKASKEEALAAVRAYGKYGAEMEDKYER